MVNIIFVVYVLMVGAPFWPIYPIAFWGAGLSVHAASVFGAVRRLEAMTEGTNAD